MAFGIKECPRISFIEPRLFKSISDDNLRLSRIKDKI